MVDAGSTIRWKVRFDPESPPVQLVPTSGIWASTIELGAGVPNVFNGLIGLADATTFVGQPGVLLNGGFADDFTRVQPFEQQNVEFRYELTFPNGLPGSTVGGFPHLPTRPPDVSEASSTEFHLFAAPILSLTRVRRKSRWRDGFKTSPSLLSRRHGCCHLWASSHSRSECGLVQFRINDAAETS